MIHPTPVHVFHFPPDIHCPGVQGTNFQVNGTGPYRLDADNVGIDYER